MEKEKQVSPGIVLSQSATFKSGPTTAPKVREPLLKRPLDVILSAFMLLLSLPVSLPIAFAIKIEDGGPVFYRQERWGRNGTRFRAYKFRTMVANSDQEFGLKQATENDPRITKVGQVLRAMGLDELPQLLNILWGEMSFVGPRSLAIGEIVRDEKGRVVKYEDIPGFQERLRVRPGLTGLATIYIPKDSPPRRKFRYDLLYIRKQSFWLDLRLIALSFWISFRGKWESRGKKA
jgi:lipopolysaccharide/colanic/teichoic acid biosynthesis glycosyltransferase